MDKDKPGNPVSRQNPELVFPGALHAQQYRWLGLGAEINLALQIPDLEKALKLRRTQQALEKLLAVKGLALPDPVAWRHPEMPYGWHETYERYMLAFPRESRVQMLKDTAPSQTGEGRSKGHKGREIHPAPVKIKE